ncbi:hypothetical protein C8R43DRAFT_956880 [Mycena crocata]|nr:hypothetical protein C8R43DRAFT_956880 [Mycena crocata]
MQSLLAEHEREVATYLPIRELTAYAVTGSLPHATATRLITDRVQALLRPYFPTSIDDFWDTMKAHHGAVLGSGPLWLTTPCPQWDPADINVVVRAGGMTPMDTYMTGQGYAEDSVEQREVFMGQVHNVSHLEDCEMAAEFKSYAHAATGRRVTVTAAAEKHIFRVVLSAQHTLQTVLLTPSCIIVLHPHDRAANRAVMRSGADYPDAERERLRFRLQQMGFTGNIDNSHWTSTCGSGCVSRLRRLRGGAGIRLFQWRSGIQADALDAVRAKTETILATRPSFPAMYTAALFPTGCFEAILVPLAVDYGVQRYRFPEDLRTYDWLGFDVLGSTMPDLAGTSASESSTSRLARREWSHSQCMVTSS